MAKTVKKKTTNKYELSRQALAAELEQLVERLSEIDTTNTSPAEVAGSVTDIQADLENLQWRVTDLA